jgi:hypothetical protein
MRDSQIIGQVNGEEFSTQHMVEQEVSDLRDELIVGQQSRTSTTSLGSCQEMEASTPSTRQS